MKILQVNLMRSKHSHDLAYELAIRRGVDVIIASEPNKNRVQRNNWIKDKRLDVAVLFINKNVDVQKVRKEQGYVCLYISNYRIYCCYSSPNIELETFRAEMDKIMNDSRGLSGDSLIIGDLNAKSPQWGSAIWDARGEYLTDWLAQVDMVVHNKGEKPTFVRGNSESFIDVTCSSQNIATKIVNWEVLDDESLSDHRFIYFEIKDQIARGTSIEKTKAEIDWEMFRTVLEWTTKSKASDWGSVSNCTRLLKQAYTSSVVSRSNKKNFSTILVESRYRKKEV